MERGENSEVWRAVFTGTDQALIRGRRFWRLLPSDPRCKMCLAPFGGVGHVVSRLRGRDRGSKNPYVCRNCETIARKYPGGAEILMTMAFADVRDSTALSARMGNAEFGTLISKFFDIATEIMGESGAFIDKLVGDAANGYYLPAFAGPEHADEGVSAMTELVVRTDREAGELGVGAGVHTGVAYIGSVGHRGSFVDFTALGEEVNLAARLAQAARAGEVLVSQATLEMCHDHVAISEWRELPDLKGIDQHLKVAVVRPLERRAT